MYTKFLTVIYAADSQIEDAISKIQSELRVDLSDSDSVNFCTFSKDTDDSYKIYFRYFPGVNILSLVNKEYKSLPVTSDKLQLGKLIIDTNKLNDTVIESDVRGNIQVVGYLEPLNKDMFNFANDLLDYIVKSLQDLLRGKYTVTYKPAFDIKKELKQKNNKWKGSEYDIGIYKLIQKIQSFCRMNFLNTVKEALIANNICTLIGYKKYESIISKEYSTVSDAYFESNEFKEKLDNYIYDLYVQKTSNINFESDFEDKLLQLIPFSFSLDNYISYIKSTGNFGVNEYPLTSFAFNSTVQNDIKTYVNDFINSAFLIKTASLYTEFFNRIALNKEQLEELKNKFRAEKDFVKIEDMLSDEQKQVLRDIKTVQEKQEEDVEDTTKESIDKSSLAEQVTDANGDKLSLEEAIKDFADKMNYTVEYKEGTGVPSKILDDSGHRVNVTDFLNNVKQEYNIEDIQSSDSYVSTSIYNDYLKPESYSQFQSRVSLILAQLLNINKYTVAYLKDLGDIDSQEGLRDVYNKIIKLIINSTELPVGIQKSLLKALNVSNVRVALEQLQMVLDVQIQILKVFNEDTDYKSARGRVNAILNEYRDLARYFNKQVESFNIQQDISKVVKETKDRPYLLAKKFRMYLNKLGWRYNAKREMFYKGKLSDILDKDGNVDQEQLNTINSELRKLLDDFNKINNSDLKFEDIYTQRSLTLEPIDIVVKDNSLTKALFNNVDEILTNSGIQDLNKKLDALSLEISNL